MLKVTMKDIAKNLNTSINTVSKALRNKDDVNQETKELIIKEANRIGYNIHSIKNNNDARARACIGLVVPDCSNPFFAQIIRSAQQTIETKNMMTLLCDTNESYIKESNYIDTLIYEKIAGVLLCATQTHDEDIKKLKDSNTPFVLIGRFFEDIETDYVISDDYVGSYQATEHLLRLGHKNIVFINAKSYVSSAKYRLKGYLDAFKNHGLEVNPNYIKESETTVESAYSVMKSIFLEGLEFSAVFTFCDLMLFGVYKAISEFGLSCPKDISLVGFDNIFYSEIHSCPFTTINQQKENLGTIGAELLLEKIISGKKKLTHITLPTELVIRESTSRINP
jgi:LacI family transcriptional regulator, galactose operon repressor